MSDVTDLKVLKLLCCHQKTSSAICIPLNAWLISLLKTELALQLLKSAVLIANYSAPKLYFRKKNGNVLLVYSFTDVFLQRCKQNKQ